MSAGCDGPSSGRVPRESFDAPENLRKETPCQGALGQLEDEVPSMQDKDKASARLEQPLLETRQGPFPGARQELDGLGRRRGPSSSGHPDFGVKVASMGLMGTGRIAATVVGTNASPASPRVVPSRVVASVSRNSACQRLPYRDATKVTQAEAPGGAL